MFSRRKKIIGLGQVITDCKYAKNEKVEKWESEWVEEQLLKCSIEWMMFFFLQQFVFIGSALLEKKQLSEFHLTELCNDLLTH